MESEKILVRDEGYDVAVWVRGKVDVRFPHLMHYNAWERAGKRVLELGRNKVVLCPNDCQDDIGLKRIKVLERLGLTIYPGTKEDNVNGWVHL